jgi:outer membrane protein assembly factor BamB
MVTWFIIAATCIAISIGAMFAFRPKRRYLAMAGLMIIVAGYVGPQLFRIESYNGNRTPRIVWRWTPSAEDEIRSYFVSAAKSHRSLEPMEPMEVQPSDRSCFQGNWRDGIVRDVSLSTDWELHPPKLLWRHPVGLGWTSFAIVGNAAINLEQRDEDECVVGYDIRSGEELWCHRQAAVFRTNTAMGRGRRR